MFIGARPLFHSDVHWGQATDSFRYSLGQWLGLPDLPYFTGSPVFLHVLLLYILYHFARKLPFSLNLPYFTRFSVATLAVATQWHLFRFIPMLGPSIHFIRWFKLFLLSFQNPMKTKSRSGPANWSTSSRISSSRPATNLATNERFVANDFDFHSIVLKLKWINF